MRRIAVALSVLIFQFTDAQVVKPKSYVINKEDNYTFDVVDNKISVVLFSQEQKWVGDKDDPKVTSNRIDYENSFEEVFDIKAYSVSPDDRKVRVSSIGTEDRQVDDIFYHDMKYKYYYFPKLEEGSQTYSSYKKKYKVPQLLDPYYFKEGLECKKSKVTLKVSNDIEIGYVLKGGDTDKIEYSTQKEGNYTIHSWQLLDSEKAEVVEGAPNISYYLPHLIFYIKNYIGKSGKQEIIGSVDNLYKYYYQNIKDINKADQTAVKNQVEELIKGLTTDSEKAKAIFDFVQTKVHYVAFEDGMGGFVPREAADVFQKKYGDCKDMANLLNEMLHYAKVESYISWIGTRRNNYKYEDVPTPIADNHMITVAKIDNQNVFLDATGRYTIYPGFTPAIQGKQALLKIDENKYEVVPVPVISADQNTTAGKINFHIEGDKLVGDADFQMKGFAKSRFLSLMSDSLEKEKNLKNYLSRFIANINTDAIEIANEDLSQNPLRLKHTFDLEKWTKRVNNQIVFKPVLFFPFSDSRIDIEKRKVAYEFDYADSFVFDYAIAIPDGYKLEYKPEDFQFKNDLVEAEIKYSQKENQLYVNQKIKVNTILLNSPQFSDWNKAMKSITKQYNQNIILTK